MNSPLAGLRVLDASRVLAGPYAAMLLADLGADVVKLERPDGGDQTRGWGPPYQGDQSAYYLSANKNKRSLALNLKRAEGQAIFSKLVQQSDVLIENFRAGTLENLGFSQHKLDRLNPQLIHCSITGYGTNGPHNRKPLYDLVLQAESGWMSITGHPHGAPVRIGVAVLDLLAAHYAVQGILASLWAQRRRSKGRYLEIIMYDVALASLCYMAQYYLATGKSPAKLGSSHPTIVPYQAFEAQDGYVVVAVASEAIWARFCRALGHEAWDGDPRFADNARRVEHRKALLDLLVPLFAQRRVETWVILFEQHDVPVAPVNDIAAALEPAQIQASGLVRHVTHPTLGMLSLLGSPLHLSKEGHGPMRAPPLLGQHTEELLQKLGYSAKDIAQLRREGVV